MKGFKRIYDALIGMGVIVLFLVASIPHHCVAVCTEEQLKGVGEDLGRQED